MSFSDPARAVQEVATGEQGHSRHHWLLFSSHRLLKETVAPDIVFHCRDNQIKPPVSFLKDCGAYGSLNFVYEIFTEKFNFISKKAARAEQRFLENDRDIQKHFHICLLVYFGNSLVLEIAAF
jgi:hypothetical protein